MAPCVLRTFAMAPGISPAQESHLGRIEARRHPAITSLTKLLIPQRSSVGRFIDPPRGFRQITAAIRGGRGRH